MPGCRATQADRRGGGGEGGRGQKEEMLQHDRPCIQPSIVVQRPGPKSSAQFVSSRRLGAGHGAVRSGCGRRGPSPSRCTLRWFANPLTCVCGTWRRRVRKRWPGLRRGSDLPSITTCRSRTCRGSATTMRRSATARRMNGRTMSRCRSSRCESRSVKAASRSSRQRRHTRPTRGTRVPGAPYNAAAKFYAVYSGDASRDHDLRISHVAIDRKHTSAEDPGTYFPLPELRRAAARRACRVGRAALSRSAHQSQPRHDA